MKFFIDAQKLASAEKYFWLENNFNWKNFGKKKIWWLEKYFAEKIFGSKKTFLVGKFIGWKICLGENILDWKKNVAEINFGF